MPSTDLLEIVYVLMEERDVDAALQLLLSKYPDPYQQAAACDNYASQVRAFVIRQPEYKNPEFDHELCALLPEAIPEDRQRILDLFNASLRVQYRTLSSKKRYLHNFRLERRLKQLKPVDPILYEFQLSDDLSQAAQEQRTQRIVAQQHHDRHDPGFYNKTETQIQELLRIATEFISKPITKTTDLWKMINALGFLCGRRNSEIYETLQWSPASHPYQTTVKGILKREGVTTGQEDEFTIPLLCPYLDFDKAMTSIREFREANATSSVVQSPCMRQQCIRLFGENYTHTQKRNIYAEMAWRNRELNGFLTGSQSCAKRVWIQHALCHNFNRIGDTDRYTVMNIS